MKVLMLTSEFEPHIKGGLGVHVTELYKKIILDGNVNIEIITVPSNKESKENRKKELFEYKQKSYFDIVLDNFGQLISVDYSGSYDLVHVQDFPSGYAGLVLSEIFEIPLILTLHDTIKGRSMAGGYSLDLISEDFLLLQKQLCKSADKVICVSESLAHEAVELLGLSLDKTVIIPNGINMIEDSRKRKFRENNILKVLFVGRFVNYKGILDLIDLAIILKNRKINFHITMIGEKENNPYSEQFYKNLNQSGLGDHFEIVSFLPREVLEKYYKETDICIVPSHYEPFGITVLEGMMSGAITMASRIGGINEIIENKETGFLFNPGDPEDMANCINEILNMDSKGQKKMIEKAKKVCSERFSWKEISRQTINQYSSLI